VDWPTRGWQDYWHWNDKPVQERASALKVLEAAGVKVAVLRSRGDDPPDCEAFLDGRWSGIEVTELVHRPTLEQSIQAQKKSEAGRIPKGADPFVWTRESLIAAIQSLIDRKDAAANRVQGGPYARYVLVIVTAETFLARDYVKEFLNGAEFRARFVTEVYFGLDYHPADPMTKEDGCNPVFRLRLKPR
jgi:hypothetical protein